MLKFLKICLFTLFAYFIPLALQAKAETIHVFAASSLKTALDKAIENYPDKTVFIRVSYASSSSLARQIELGAPADIFISADIDWMDYIEIKGFVRQGSRFDFAGNRLVLIAPKSAPFERVELTAEELQRVIGNGRLMTGEVKTVPVGKYAKQALVSLKLWKSVQPLIAGAESARSALNFVALGEAILGIVYESDAKAEPRVKTIAEFPHFSHQPIVYPAGLIKNSKNGANAFLNYIRQGKGFSFFIESGFYAAER